MLETRKKGFKAKVETELVDKIKLQQCIFQYISNQDQIKITILSIPIVTSNLRIKFQQAP